MSNNLVHGEWHVNINKPSVADVYCDASDQPMDDGAALKYNGVPVEGRLWLLSKNDKRHINIAELDAVIKSLEGLER